jgi:hypothetical protein
LVTEIDAEKLRLCDKPKMVSDVMLINAESEAIKRSLKEMKRVVKECRRELENIESITFSHSKKSFEFEYLTMPCAVIDIEAKGIQFQVTLKILSINSS